MRRKISKRLLKKKLTNEAISLLKDGVKLEKNHIDYDEKGCLIAVFSFSKSGYSKKISACINVSSLNKDFKEAVSDMFKYVLYGFELFREKNYTSAVL